MKTKILKTAVFLFLFSLIFFLFDEIFRWKDYQYQVWPNSATVSGFYKMERNSVDVLFLGSSQGVTAFDPQVVYDEFGIRSYNLSTEQQSLVVSYYLLKEAIRRQNLGAVVLDVGMCFGNQNPLNSAESCVRKVVDQMRWSPLKKEFIHDICRLDPTLKKKSFYFRNLRYHERWKSLNPADFEFSELNEPMMTKGYAAESVPWRSGEFKPYAEDESAGAWQMQENMEKYLSKIADFCAKNGIPLVLVKNPNLGWNVNAHQTLRQFSDARGIEFIDFNEERAYAEAEYDYAKDGDIHLDNVGAAKVSRFLGKKLLLEYGIEPKEDNQWESTRAHSEAVAAARYLPHITEIREYLSMLPEHDFAVFVAVKDEGTASLNEEVLQKLSAVGIKTNLQGQYRKNFYFVSGTDKNAERISDAKIGRSGTIRSGRVHYEIQSAGWNSGNDCSIKIDGWEWAKRQRGLNIVVYSPALRQVVDSVCFDTCAPEMRCIR